MESGTWKFELPSKYDYSDEYVDYDDDEDDDGGDDDEGGGEVETDYPCPFCSEDFDIVGLCCHIEDEHYDEAKKGVCTMCGTSVGGDLVEHIVRQHENVHKIHSRSKSRDSDADSQSTLALLRKELLERSLKALTGNSSSVESSSNAAVDQMLTSFIGSYLTLDEAKSKPSTSLAEISVREELTDVDELEMSMKNCAISEEQEEQAQRCKYVQSILFSTFLDDGL